jgi:hypothetical protein
MAGVNRERRRPVSRAQFARVTAILANHAAHYTEMTLMNFRLDGPVGTEAVRRFIADIRKMMDSLEADNEGRPRP